MPWHYAMLCLLPWISLGTLFYSAFHSNDISTQLEAGKRVGGSPKVIRVIQGVGLRGRLQAGDFCSTEYIFLGSQLATLM